jgi:diaminohydroxyphosphoribosylaminopyrimidine deaminase/5-amino-6-(5-phosphoribosylamino)uracil reductase
VLVGIGTALSDDPRLTVRITESPPQISQSPWAVVLDTKARLPLQSYLVTQRAEELIVYTTETAGPPDSLEAELSRQHFSPRELQDIRARVGALRAAGVQVRTVPLDESGRLLLPHILQDLMRMGIQSMMVEGGAEIAGAFLSRRLYDALYLYIAPILIGGDGKGIGPLHVGKVAGALQLEEVEVRSIDGQMAVFGFRSGWYAGVTQALREDSYVYGTC